MTDHDAYQYIDCIKKVKKDFNLGSTTAPKKVGMEIEPSYDEKKEKLRDAINKCYI